MAPPVKLCKVISESLVRAQRSFTGQRYYCHRDYKSKAPGSQLVNAEVNSVVVIAVLAPNFTLQVMHQSIPAVPIPPRADPRELAFFENELANAPPPGQKTLFKCPGVGAQKCFISFVSRLSFNKI